jgi:MarR family transcriptional regulator, organic hydroperoxide resistance regulator
MTPDTQADPVCDGSALSGTGPSAPATTADGVCTGTESPLCTQGNPTGFAVARVARLHRMAVGKALRSAGLYPGQESVMLYLWRVGPVRQSDLIRTTDLDPSTVTKMLQRLEQAGHVRRRPDPADRRAVLVEATAESCGLRFAVEEALGGVEESMLAGLDGAERAELTRLLALVEANLCEQAGDCAGVTGGREPLL